MQYNQKYQYSLYTPIQQGGHSGNEFYGSYGPYRTGAVAPLQAVNTEENNIDAGHQTQYSPLSPDFPDSQGGYYSQSLSPSSATEYAVHEGFGQFRPEGAQEQIWDTAWSDQHQIAECSNRQSRFYTDRSVTCGAFVHDETQPTAVFEANHPSYPYNNSWGTAYPMGVPTTVAVPEYLPTAPAEALGNPTSESAYYYPQAARPSIKPVPTLNQSHGFFPLLAVSPAMDAGVWSAPHDRATTTSAGESSTSETLMHPQSQPNTVAALSAELTFIDYIQYVEAGSGVPIFGPEGIDPVQLERGQEIALQDPCEWQAHPVNEPDIGGGRTSEILSDQSLQHTERALASPTTAVSRVWDTAAVNDSVVVAEDIPSPLSGKSRTTGKKRESTRAHKPRGCLSSESTALAKSSSSPAASAVKRGRERHQCQPLA